MSGDQNLGDKLRLYPARAEICHWQSWGCCRMQNLLDFVGVRNKAASIRHAEAKNEERGLGEKVMGVVLVFIMCTARMYNGNWSQCQGRH